METDYKIVQYKQYDDGSSMARIRYYVGSEVPVEKYDLETDSFVMVTEYRRTSMYEETEYTFDK